MGLELFVENVDARLPTVTTIKVKLQIFVIHKLSKRTHIRILRIIWNYGAIDEIVNMIRHRK